MHVSRKIIQQISRDDGVIKVGVTVYFFDPYDNAALKRGVAVEINSHGAEIKTDRGTFCYSRLALWVNKERAKADGPPHEIYNYKKQATVLVG